MNFPIKKFKEVTDIISGGTPKSTEASYFGGTTLWLTPTDLSKNKAMYVESSIRTLTAEGIKNSSAKIIPKNSVTLSSRAPIGYVAISTKPFTTNQGMKSFVPKKELFNEYLYYYLLYSKSALEKEGSGTTFKEISKSKLEEFSIPVPELSEQKKIVSKIKTCFNHLDNVERKLKCTEEKSTKLLDSILKKTLKTNIPKLQKLGEIADLINGDRGKNYPGKSALVKEGHPFITAGHIQNHMVNFQKMNFISEERFNILNSGKVQKGDILYCLRGSLGKIAFIDFTESAAIASSLVIIRPRTDINSKYLYYYLLSQYGQKQIKEYDNGTAQPNLSAASLKKFILVIPKRSTQDEIVSQIENSTINIDRIMKRIQNLTKQHNNIRQSILKNAFEGKFI